MTSGKENDIDTLFPDNAGPSIIVCGKDSTPDILITSNKMGRGGKPLASRAVCDAVPASPIGLTRSQTFIILNGETISKPNLDSNEVRPKIKKSKSSAPSSTKRRPFITSINTNRSTTTHRPTTSRAPSASSAATLRSYNNHQRKVSTPRQEEPVRVNRSRNIPEIIIEITNQPERHHEREGNNNQQTFRSQFMSSLNKSNANPVWFVDVGGTSASRAQSKQRNSSVDNNQSEAMIFNNENYNPGSRCPLEKRKFPGSSCDYELRSRRSYTVLR